MIETREVIRQEIERLRDQRLRLVTLLGDLQQYALDADDEDVSQLDEVEYRLRLLRARLRAMERRCE